MSQDNKYDDKKSAPPVLPTDTTGGADKQAGLISKMQTVKSAWDKAPEGDKKSKALKHYQSAENAQRAGNEAEAVRELEQATRALA